jgi:hypothetical protein
MTEHGGNNKGAILMNCRFRFPDPKHLRVAARLGLLVLFSPVLSLAHMTPSGDSYTNTAGPAINYLSRTLVSYLAAIALAFTILIALACAGVLALTGIYLSNQRQGGKSCKPMSRIAAV